MKRQGFSKELTAVFSGAFLSSASASALVFQLKGKNTLNMANLWFLVNPYSLETLKVKYLKEAQHSASSAQH